MFKRILKILVWVIASLLVLLILLGFLITLPPVQDFLKEKALAYVRDKTHTKVELGTVRIGFPEDILLEGLYLEDQQQDTLLYLNSLQVNISMMKLLTGQVEVNNAKIQGLTANVYRDLPDTVFNYQFLIDAFVSGEEEEPEETGTGSVDIKIGTIALEAIRLHYRDEPEGMDAGIAIGSLHTSFGEIDLDKMRFKIHEILLKESDLRYVRAEIKIKAGPGSDQEGSQEPGQADSGDQSPDEALPVVEIGQVDLNKIRLLYEDEPEQTKADIDLGTLQLRQVLADMTTGRYETDRIGLSASKFLVSLHLPETADPGAGGTADTLGPPPEAGSPQTESAPMSFLAKEIRLDEIAAEYHNTAVKGAGGRQMDYNHLGLQEFTMHAKDFRYAGDSLQMALVNTRLRERSGFTIDQLAGAVRYSGKGVEINELVFDTPHSRVRASTRLGYLSTDDFTSHPERVTLDLTVPASSFGLRDAVYFYDSLPGGYENLTVTLQADAGGRLSDLDIREMLVAGAEDTRVSARGKVRLAAEMEKSVFDIEIPELHTSRADLHAFLPDSLVNAYELPASLTAKGFFKGSMEDFSSALDVRSDLGNMAFQAHMKTPQETPVYEADARIEQLALGRLLKNDELDNLSLQVRVQGAGFDMESARVDAKGELVQLGYHDYSYEQLAFNAGWKEQQLQLQASMADTNLAFTLNSQVNIAAAYPAVFADLELGKADLHALHFSDTTLSFAGHLTADLPVADPDSLNGRLQISGLQAATESYPSLVFDTVMVSAATTPDSSRIDIRSEFLSGSATGKYELTKIGDAFAGLINRYYTIGEYPDTLSGQQLDARFRFSLTDNLKALIPSVDTFETADISLRLDTRTDSLLEAELFFPETVYSGIRLDSVRLTADNRNPDSLRYRLDIGELSNPTVALYRNSIYGNLADNQFTTNVSVSGEDLEESYRLSTLFRQEGDSLLFSLLDPLVLDKQTWKVHPGNQILVIPEGIIARDVNISSGRQVLHVQSEPAVGGQAPDPKSPLNIRFEQFDIQTLTRFTRADSALAGGIIDGEVHLAGLDSNLTFQADLGIRDLQVLQTPLGHLQAQVQNTSGNAYEADVKLSGVHELALTGTYYTDPESRYDLLLDITSVDLKQIEPLTMGQVSDLKGGLSGQFTVKGTAETPEVKGELGFKDVGFNAAYINIPMSIPDETIRFTGDAIRFDRFTLVDPQDQKAVIDGAIFTTDFTDYRFNVDFTANDFMVLNTTRQDNDMFYGKLFLTSHLRLRGDLHEPDVDLDLKINDQTDMTYILPLDDPSVAEQGGVVRFVDKDAPPVAEQVERDTTVNTPFGGLNLNARIHTDPEALFHVYIDPTSNDRLDIQGESQLAASIDRNGDFNITGRYEVKEGKYGLSVGPLVRREFTIQAGSSITWTGSPYSANIDITALYTALTSPMDLVEDLLQDMDESARNAYKQRFPFEVYLMLGGEMMKPDISFRIDMRQQDQNAFGGTVYTRIKQLNTNVSELNKQVFALLVLNRFISNNPFQSLAGGASMEHMARQSAGRLLTDQLNNLAADLIQGVDVSFSLESTENYSSGSAEQQTDMGIDLSKSLLNDRLIVSVGSDFALEGGNQPGRKTSNIAGDVSIQYKLSRDGRYRLRVYRKDQYQGIIEGQIIETGVGFTFLFDYDKVSEILRKRRAGRAESTLPAGRQGARNQESRDEQ